MGSTNKGRKYIKDSKWIENLDIYEYPVIPDQSMYLDEFFRILNKFMSLKKRYLLPSQGYCQNTFGEEVYFRDRFAEKFTIDAAIKKIAFYIGEKRKVRRDVILQLIKFIRLIFIQNIDFRKDFPREVMMEKIKECIDLYGNAKPRIELRLK